ncbi:carboxylating nicotinate-nucleotide diphosphorylase [Kibdelosporangium philippinense]|uniref:nicotinate-nucleotide diphosphorylase (carboxylating) n=1 Tax=Kibdelosporangium philippinense TaxID=211113 RepID=A0ABS8ZI35_9PSEU|nr:carboxylating nicotinate-nucleotide diphosphorylase [Kibdelosporangium philippinense]MCE7007415.1 carboxylating nicotinate-nucleotide diphosphorylase [Kibdelosporangium philippinense]
MNEEALAVVDWALAEDLRYGPDVTTEATVPADAIGTAAITPRKTGVLAGNEAALAVFRRRVDNLEVLTRTQDGVFMVPGEAVLVVRGSLRGLLTAERTALNLVSHLSGVATLTRAWVDAIEGTGCVIRDTRKTTPGMRLLEKHAVRMGGGQNHRLGLGDAVLIKDNHVLAAGSITAAFTAARQHAPQLPCEVEVDTLDQLDEALGLGVELVLLDNFTPEQCVEAVRRAAGTRTELEASGGLTLDVARAYAETGVHYLAVGALTHSAPIVDIGMDLAPVETPAAVSAGR